MSDIARPDDLRIGDAERERAAAALAEHLAAGRLDADEYTDRVGRAYAARTAVDLQPLFRDLPALRPPQPERKPRPLDLRVPLLILLLVASVAWIALLRVPPFFIFPLMWIFIGFAGAGRRYARRW
jgi:hypothetical protein